MIRLNVNGDVVGVEAENESNLLTALRDEVGLVGTRFGCGEGLCGACVVLVDGTPMFSCQTPIWQAAAASEITTIEGLSAAGEPHPVQQALLDGQAAQCGFCIAGIVMRAVALRSEHPQPTREQVIEALLPHLCRCGSHQRIVDALTRMG